MSDKLCPEDEALFDRMEREVSDEMRFYETLHHKQLLEGKTAFKYGRFKYFPYFCADFMAKVKTIEQIFGLGLLWSYYADSIGPQRRYREETQNQTP